MPSRRAVLVWVILALLSVPLQRLLDSRLSGIGTVRGSESALVDQRLRTEFSAPFVSPALLVMTGLRMQADVDSSRADVREIVARVAAHPAVRSTISPASSLDTLLFSASRTTAVAVVGLQPGYEHAIDSIRSLAASTMQSLRRTHPALTLRWTGEQAVVEDLRTEGAREARRAELRTLPVTSLIAVWAFGSIGAAFSAVGATALVIAVSLGVLGALTVLAEPSLPERALVPLIALALTVDYSLYLRLSALGGVPRRSAHRTVGVAALAVAIGFAGLLAAPTGELRAAAVGGIVTAALAACAAVTLAPVLSTPGTAASPTSSRWHAWAKFVVRRPVLVLASCGLPLALLVREAVQANLAGPLEGWLPEGVESSDALVDLERAERDGLAGTLRLLLDVPSELDVLTPEGWKVIARASVALRAVQGVADVRSLATIGTGSLLVARDVLPSAVRDRYVSRNRHAAVFDIVPSLGGGRSDAVALVKRLRAVDPTRIAGVKGTHIAVAGLPAYALDYPAAIQHAIPWIVVGTAFGSFFALAAVFRAPVVALKAVVLNLLVAASAVGATCLAFQSRGIAHVLGHEPVTSIFPTVPALAFVATFGISMDYELFLLGGVLEARRRGASDRDAIVSALVRSGPVIVRAAAIMVGLFLAFATSAQTPLAMVGFALAAAVALDASLVRLALAPALLRLAGRWNWWPNHERSP